MSANRPTVAAPYLVSNVEDVDLDSAAWTQAQPVLIDRYWSGRPAPLGRQAEARILWSANALHVRFVCNQAEPLVIDEHPQTATKAMGLWDRDVGEIFIATHPDSVEKYFEFEVAPTGEWLDVEVSWTGSQRQSNWNVSSQMRTAARIENEHVMMAMHIPWVVLPEPEVGRQWRINLLRCVGKAPDRGYLAWQPTRTAEPNFHVPQAFGWLEFC